MKKNVARLYSFVEKKYKGSNKNPGLEKLAISRYNDRLHGFDHICRVLHWVRKIGAKEHANILVLEAAALLHDIAIAEVGDATHARVGAEKAKTILSTFGFNANEITQICKAIRQHSTDDPSKEKRSLEGNILFDSDKLDALGAIGFLRFVQDYQKQGVAINKIPGKIKAHLKKWQENYGEKIFFTETAQKISKKKFKQLLSLVELLELETKIS